MVARSSTGRGLVALEASPAFSVAHVSALLNGTMAIEELSAMERTAFVERLPEAFLNPAPNLLAVYSALSEDDETGSSPQDRA